MFEFCYGAVTQWENRPYRADMTDSYDYTYMWRACLVLGKLSLRPIEIWGEAGIILCWTCGWSHMTSCLVTVSEGKMVDTELDPPPIHFTHATYLFLLLLLNKVMSVQEDCSNWLHIEQAQRELNFGDRDVMLVDSGNRHGLYFLCFFHIFYALISFFHFPQLCTRPCTLLTYYRYTST